MHQTHKSVLLHVGFIKTATTFLQHQVFSRPGSGLELAAGRDTRAHLVEHIILADDYVFDAAKIRQHFEQTATPVRGRGNLPIWSEEMLLGNPPARRYDGWDNARKLYAVFPNAKVLITIRNQTAMALSVYGEYIRGGGTLPLKAFIGSGREPMSYRPLLDPNFMRFDHAIAHFQSLFGAKNVLVLPQEMLRRTPALYLSALSDFTGGSFAHQMAGPDAHSGEGSIAQSLRRCSNRFILRDPTAPRRHGLTALQDRIIRRIDRLIPDTFGKRILTQKKNVITNRYVGLFAQSNHRTAELTGLDLEGLGYEVSSP